MENILNGVIILNKPTGMSSMTAVSKVRRILNVKKAGHLGTLDPLASGVLPIAIGNATKLFEAHLKDRKIYRAIFLFGKTTDTFDSEGKITAENDKVVSKEKVVSLLEKFKGEFEQMPPDYSAKKIGGVCAYKLARQGKTVELKPKLITIYDIKLLNEIKQNVFSFEIECSSGTYIRSIVRDMAKMLDTFGTMIGLIRMSSGIYDIEKSTTLDEVNENKLITKENQ